MDFTDCMANGIICVMCLYDFVDLLIQHIDSDSGIVMVDLVFGDDFFKQNRSWDDFGTIISGI